MEALSVAQSNQEAEEVEKSRRGIPGSATLRRNDPHGLSKLSLYEDNKVVQLAISLSAHNLAQTGEDEEEYEEDDDNEHGEDEDNKASSSHNTIHSDHDEELPISNPTSPGNDPDINSISATHDISGTRHPMVDNPYSLTSLHEPLSHQNEQIDIPVTLNLESVSASTIKSPSLRANHGSFALLHPTKGHNTSSSPLSPSLSPHHGSLRRPSHSLPSAKPSSSPNRQPSPHTQPLPHPNQLSTDATIRTSTIDSIHVDSGLTVTEANQCGIDTSERDLGCSSDGNGSFNNEEKNGDMFADKAAASNNGKNNMFNIVVTDSSNDESPSLSSQSRRSHSRGGTRGSTSSQNDHHDDGQHDEDLAMLAMPYSTYDSNATVTEREGEHWREFIVVRKNLKASSKNIGKGNKNKDGGNSEKASINTKARGGINTCIEGGLASDSTAYNPVNDSSSSSNNNNNIQSDAKYTDNGSDNVGKTEGEDRSPVLRNTLLPRENTSDGSISQGEEDEDHDDVYESGRTLDFLGAPVLISGIHSSVDAADDAAASFGPLPPSSLRDETGRIVLGTTKPNAPSRHTSTNRTTSKSGTVRNSNITSSIGINSSPSLIPPPAPFRSPSVLHTGDKFDSINEDDQDADIGNGEANPGDIRASSTTSIPSPSSAFATTTTSSPMLKSSQPPTTQLMNSSQTSPPTDAISRPLSTSPAQSVFISAPLTSTTSASASSTMPLPIVSCPASCPALPSCSNHTSAAASSNPCSSTSPSNIGPSSNTNNIRSNNNNAYNSVGSSTNDDITDSPLGALPVGPKGRRKQAAPMSVRSLFDQFGPNDDQQPSSSSSSTDIPSSSSPTPLSGLPSSGNQSRSIVSMPTLENISEPTGGDVNSQCPSIPPSTYSSRPTISTSSTSPVNTVSVPPSTSSSVIDSQAAPPIIDPSLSRFPSSSSLPSLPSLAPNTNGYPYVDHLLSGSGLHRSTSAISVTSLSIPSVPSTDSPCPEASFIALPHTDQGLPSNTNYSHGLTLPFPTLPSTLPTSFTSILPSTSAGGVSYPHPPPFIPFNPSPTVSAPSLPILDGINLTNLPQLSSFPLLPILAPSGSPTHPPTINMPTCPPPASSVAGSILSTSLSDRPIHPPLPSSSFENTSLPIVATSLPTTASLSTPTNVQPFTTIPNFTPSLPDSLPISVISGTSTPANLGINGIPQPTTSTLSTSTSHPSIETMLTPYTTSQQLPREGVPASVSHPSHLPSGLSSSEPSISVQSQNSSAINSSGNSTKSNNNSISLSNDKSEKRDKGSSRPPSRKDKDGDKEKPNTSTTKDERGITESHTGSTSKKSLLPMVGVGQSSETRGKRKWNRRWNRQYMDSIQREFEERRFAFIRDMDVYASDEARVQASARAFYVATFEHAYKITQENRHLPEVRLAH